LTTVVVDKETLPILLSVAEGTSVKYVIVDGTPSQAELASANEKNIKLEEFKNVEAIGAAHPTSPVVPGTVERERERERERGCLLNFLVRLSWVTSSTWLMYNIAYRTRRHLQHILYQSFWKGQ
jgi:hypothetical protein